MTLKELAYVGGMPLAEFSDHCLDIAYLLARTAHDRINNGDYYDYKSGLVIKDSYDGTAGGDIALPVDIDLQKLFVRLVKEKLPQGIGLQGEEQGLRQPSRLPRKVTLILDPVDGTRCMRNALDKKQMPDPGQTSVMLTLMIDGISVASYVIDIATLVCIMRDPYKRGIWEIMPNGARRRLSGLPRTWTLGQGTLSWHGVRDAGSPLAKLLVSDAGPFRKIVRPQGSVGLFAGQVLYGDPVVAALCSAGRYTTPWDDGPMRSWVDAGRLVTLYVMDDYFQEVSIPVQQARHDRDILYILEHHIDELSRYGEVVRLLR